MSSTALWSRTPLKVSETHKSEPMRQRRRRKACGWHNANARELFDIDLFSLYSSRARERCRRSSSYTPCSSSKDNIGSKSIITSSYELAMRRFFQQRRRRHRRRCVVVISKLNFSIESFVACSERRGPSCVARTADESDCRTLLESPSAPWGCLIRATETTRRFAYRRSELSLASNNFNALTVMLAPG